MELKVVATKEELETLKKACESNSCVGIFGCHHIDVWQVEIKGVVFYYCSNAIKEARRKSFTVRKIKKYS